MFDSGGSLFDFGHGGGGSLAGLILGPDHGKPEQLTLEEAGVVATEVALVTDATVVE